MNNPLISIIVPCYNQAQYLSEALQSVLNQTYINWECIIVNDGSPDDTAVVAQEWVAKDFRFKYIYKENGGLSSARNAGLDEAVGIYVQFLDADDVLESSKFEKSLRKIFDFECDIVVTNFRMFFNDISESTDPFCVIKNEYLNYENIVFNWDYLFSIPIHCGFFKKIFFEEFRFPIELRAKEDWIMWMLIFKNNSNCIFIDESLVFYRQHYANMTSNRQLMEKSLFESLLISKSILENNEYEDLLILKLKRTFDQVDQATKKYRLIKDSNSFKFGFKVKRMLMKMNLLSFSKQVLNHLK